MAHLTGQGVLGLGVRGQGVPGRGSGVLVVKVIRGYESGSPNFVQKGVGGWVKGSEVLGSGSELGSGYW